MKTSSNRRAAVSSSRRGEGVSRGSGTSLLDSSVGTVTAGAGGGTGEPTEGPVRANGSSADSVATHGAEHADVSMALPAISQCNSPK